MTGTIEQIIGHNFETKKDSNNASVGYLFSNQSYEIERETGE
jgi:hypothetical protein